MPPGVPVGTSEAAEQLLREDAKAIRARRLERKAGKEREGSPSGKKGWQRKAGKERKG